MYLLSESIPNFARDISYIFCQNHMGREHFLKYLRQHLVRFLLLNIEVIELEPVRELSLLRQLDHLRLEPRH
jgi:hypothetical protein